MAAQPARQDHVLHPAPHPLLDPSGQSQKPGGALDAAQLAAFERDGFLVVREMLGEPRMAELEGWTNELAAAPEMPGRHMVYGETSLIDQKTRLIQRIENFCPFHPGFDRLLNSGPLLEATAMLFGEPAVLFKDKINFKMAGGEGFKPHQDQQAGWSKYASLFITVMIAIDDATVENGCLEIAPGQHRRGLLGPEWRPLEATDMAGFTLEPLPVKAGDVVFFDSYVPHGSRPNMSNQQRRVLYITYNRLSEGDHRQPYFAEKRSNFPPDIEREPGKDYVFRV